ncbi:hypothetical protein CYMTET_38056 [Cymbomonas tetramitiformis]|uniref:Uncharacterized protein n=1 Tax=Cymbomonas tetramitiformis TaxID=36881 RepID=A0AAE0CCQ7_9CHLO|nr:hypothetical protein CYMTET_38056 [Cymbomonas tetramitiformis]
MLRCTTSVELGYDAIDAPGERRSPPPQPRAATAAVARASSAEAGPSGAGPSAQEASTYDTPARQARPPSPSSECSDWSTIDAASKPTDRSTQTWLSPKEVADLYHICSLTVSMVRYIDSSGSVLLQLGSCYKRRGLACHGDISASVMRQYNKTISCAQNGWHLPLGGQTKAKHLKEAVELAYEGLVSNHTRAFRCMALLEHNVATGTAHVCAPLSGVTDC